MPDLLKTSKKILLIIILFFAGNFLFLPVSAQALTVPPVNFVPQVSLPGSQFTTGASVPLSKSTKSIADYIQAIYNYSVGVIGILAAIIIMIAGTIWITAAGNETKISEAKEWLGAAFTGLALVLLAYMIFKTVNPNLVNLKITPVESIKQQTFMDCCGGSDGIKRIAVKIGDDGKNYLLTPDASGKDQLATCKDGVACKPTDMCIGFNNSYKCVEGNISDQCRSDNYCLASDATPDGWFYETNSAEMIVSLGTGIGVGGNRCITEINKKPGFCYVKAPIKGESCGSKDGAKCFFQECPTTPNYIIDSSFVKSPYCGYQLVCCAPLFTNAAKPKRSDGTERQGFCQNSSSCGDGYSHNGECSDNSRFCEINGEENEYCGADDVGICKPSFIINNISGGRDCGSGLYCWPKL